MKKASYLLTLILILSLVFTGCGKTELNSDIPATAEINADYENATYIVLSGDKATVNEKAVESFDYTWNIDPSKEEPWYEGTEPKTSEVCYIARDIWYYPMLDESKFVKMNYDGETEWVYYYENSNLKDYIFSTLPVLGNALPKEMMHDKNEAYSNPVLHITEPGTYVLTGTWNGQIMVDLGDKDECFTDESKKVTLILDNCNVTCTVAPAFICYSAYECDNTWEDRETYSNTVDTKDAGINIILADGSVNSFTGANIYRLLKPTYKKDSTSVQKKLLKIDGAFYSYVSMNINGEKNGSGILNVTSTTFEGMGSELHLTINGGYINVYSQDDAINVNEDNVSVFTMNDGTLHIFAGLGAEGDGVDSNGYIVVNGGLIAGGTPSGSDSLLDSDRGNTINGGQVIVIGSSGFGGGMGMMRPDGFGGNDRPDGFGGNNRPDNNGGKPGFDNGFPFDPSQFNHA
ncbi:MAG: carbohydrate-binding domain-containing protein [Clostridia bacterium]|nr:carbohydrate-binding domain-containing protein [Clostridia bacterium]